VILQPDLFSGDPPDYKRGLQSTSSDWLWHARTWPHRNWKGRERSLNQATL